MKHYRRPWDEPRGDQFDEWGTSVWYFEVGDDDVVLRQIEVYENGTVITYDADHPHDDYGGLSQVPLDPDEFAPFRISAVEFENVWDSTTPLNR